MAATNDDTGATLGSSPISKVLTNNVATNIQSLTLASGSVAAVSVTYVIEVRDGTNFQVYEGLISAHATNKAGVIANNTISTAASQGATTSGTLAVTFALSAASPALLSVNANSSLTPSTGYPSIRYWLTDLTQQGTTAQ